MGCNFNSYPSHRVLVGRVSSQSVEKAAHPDTNNENVSMDAATGQIFLSVEQEPPVRHLVKGTRDDI